MAANAQVMLPAGEDDEAGRDKLAQKEKPAPSHHTVYNYTEAYYSDDTIDNQLTYNGDESQEQWLETIRDQMEADMQSMFTAIPDLDTQNATNIVCAILGQKEDGDTTGGSVRKFVFTNVFEYRPKAFPDNTDFRSSFIPRVHELKYHLVQAQQSHSEMALLQFLHIYQDVYNPKPLALVSKRNICSKCNELLSLLWGEAWKKDICPVHEADAEMRYKRWYTPAVLVDFISDHEDIFKTFMERNKPEYATYWDTHAPEYVGCTSGDDQPLWRCSSPEFCFRHGSVGGNEQKDREASIMSKDDADDGGQKNEDPGCGDSHGISKC